MGKQYPLRVGASGFFLDLLFYHTRLRCYVVVEIKSNRVPAGICREAQLLPQVIGGQLRHPSDGPSIGILLCKTRDKIVVVYALQNISSPLGVAEYRLTESIPENLKGKLPSAEDLENELRATELE